MAIAPASLSALGKSLTIKGGEEKPSNVKKLSLSDLQAPEAKTDRIDATKVKHFVETAVDAVDSIISLREKQEELVDQAATANSETRNNISEELDAISTEITRISTDATYNGKNVLSGGSFTIKSSARNYSATVSVAQSSSVAAHYNLNTTSTGNLTRAANSVDDAIFSARNISTNLSAREYKASSIITELSETRIYSSDILTESETTDDKSTIQKLAAELTMDLIAAEGNEVKESSKRIDTSLTNSNIGSLIDELI